VPPPPGQSPEPDADASSWKADTPALVGQWSTCTITTAMQPAAAIDRRASASAACPRHAALASPCRRPARLLRAACLAVRRVASTKARAANYTTTAVETRVRRRRRSPSIHMLHAICWGTQLSSISSICLAALPRLLALPLRRNKAIGVSAAEAMEHCCARSHWPTPVMESSTRTPTHRRFSAMQALLGSKVLEVAKVALPTGSTAATP
jgi:hypothetical protein